MKNKPYKRFLAFLLCAAMLITYMPSTAFTFADEGSDEQQTVEEAKPAAPAAEKKVEKKEEKKEEAKAEKAPAPAAEEKVEAPAPEPKAEEPAETPKEEPAEKPEASGDETRAGPDETEPVKETADEPAEEVSGEVVDESAEEAVEETTEEALEETGEEAVDEEALVEEEEEEKEGEEKEEEKFPAFSKTKYFDDAKVVISAPEGALPEGVRVEIVPVKAERVEGAVEGLMGGDTRVVTAYDITFYDKEGIKFDPNDKVKVEIISSKIGAAENISVLHINSNGAAEMAENGKVSGNIASFRSDDFSIYVVVEGVDPDARLYVNFYESDGETLIAQMSLTKNQLDAGQMNVNIYDPGAGTMESGDVFKGWIDKKNYTVEDKDSGKTIAQIRERVTNLLNAGTVEDGDELNYYAMMFKSYHISYRDELAVTIHTDEVLYKEGDTEIPYTFQFAYTPYYVTGSDEDDETKAANFDGWKVMEPEVTPAEVYDNGDDIDLIDYDLSETSLTLTVMAQVAYGHWLVFNENGSGASFTEPLFVGTDETPQDAGMPAAPTRPGYDFKGWYKEAECTTAFDPAQPITQTTNVWAKWEEKTEANFTVLIWEERLGGGYDFVRSINIEDAETGEDMAAAIRGAVGDSTITVDGESVFIPMTTNATRANAGFMYEKFDTNTEDNKVASNGTSVLNVYFERRTYTLKFYYARSQNGRYQVSQNYDAPTAHGSGTSTGGTWVPGGNQRPTTAPGCTFGGSGSETRGTYTYYYRTLTAEYGEDISSSWPTYDQFDTFSNYRLGSWAIMHTSQAYINDGQGTIKGKITVMDEQILGDLSSANGNYVYANYDTANSQYDWIYNIYFKNEAGNYELYESVNARSHDSGTNWQTQQHPPAYPGMEEVRRQRVGNNREINYYYDPLPYPILFKDGVYVTGNGRTIKNNNSNTLRALQDNDAIDYKSDVSEYNGYDPTDKIPDGSDYVFLGWYSDDQCTIPYNFNRMPIGGITVYAKWVLKEYKVTLHPQEKGDTSFQYINGQPAGQYAGDSDEFYVDNGEKVGNVGGTRDLYDLIGWFTNEGLTKVWDFGAFTMNDTIVSKYGRLYGASEINPDYPGTVGEINLYASWRRILDGADGIDVIYTAVGKDGDGNTVEGSGAPTDPNKYSDQAQAIARPACQAPEAGEGETQLAFQYWVVQTWNETEYVDNDESQRVYPGDRFRVNYDDAKIEDAPTAENPDAKKYTIRLRPQYGSAEDATPTHIYWYNNYVDSEAGIIDKNEPLAINQTVDILAAPERAGYEFLGWARKPETNAARTETYYTYDVGEDDLFLTYDSESGEYTYTATGGTAKTATGVFADENTPYDGMYAVWKAAKYNITVTKTYDGIDALPDAFKITYTDGKETPVYSGTLLPSDVTPSGKTYTWTIRNVAYDTELTFTEEGYEKDGYSVKAEAKATVDEKVTPGTDNVKMKVGMANTVAFTNTYVKDDPKLTVEKSVTQITPANGDAITDADAIKNYKADVGDVISYKIVVTNTGNVKLEGIEVSDSLVDLDVEPFDLAPKGTKTITYTYTVTQEDVDAGTGVKNVATAKKGDTEDEDEITVPVTPKPGLDVKKSVTKITPANGDAITDADAIKNYKADVGDVISYKVVVTNTGNVKLEGIEVNDSLVPSASETFDLDPKGTKTITYTYKVTQDDVNAGTGVKNVATAKKGDTKDEDEITVPTVTPKYTVTYKYTGDLIPEGAPAVPAPATYEVGAPVPAATVPTLAGYTFHGWTGEVTTMPAHDVEVTGYWTETPPEPPAPEPSLKVTKTSNVEPGTKVKLGDEITYTVTVENTGNVAIDGITVTDTLVDVTEPPFTLAAGASKIITYTYTVTQADVDKGSVVNHATASGGGTDDDDEIEIPTEDPKPEVKVTKTASPSEGATEGTTIKYTIVVENTGNVTVKGITIDDSLVNVNVDPFDLAPGKTKTIKYSYKVTAADVEAGSVSNTATAKGTDPSGDDTPPGTDTVVVTTEEDDDDDTPTPTPAPPAPAPAGPAGPAPGGPGVVPAAPVDGTPIADEPVPEAEPEVEIPEEATPLAEGTWALLNLIAAALTTLGAIVALFRKKEEEDEEDEEDQNKPKTDEEEEEDDNRGKKMLAAKIAGAVAGVAAPITFFLTEDMSLPMAMVDKWTLLMVVFLAAQVVTAVLNKKASELDDEKEEEAEPAN